MCGIVALAGRQEGEWISRMNGAIVHRGPDDQGIYRSPDQSVSLAMRRLSILDLDGGHQPMSDASGQVWIVFNGEIFNAPELRVQLEQQGHQFRTKNLIQKCCCNSIWRKAQPFWTISSNLTRSRITHTTLRRLIIYQLHVRLSL